MALRADAGCNAHFVRDPSRFAPMQDAMLAALAIHGASRRSRIQDAGWLY